MQKLPITSTLCVLLKCTKAPDPKDTNFYFENSAGIYQFIALDTTCARNKIIQILRIACLTANVASHLPRYHSVGFAHGSQGQELPVRQLLWSGGYVRATQD